MNVGAVIGELNTNWAHCQDFSNEFIIDGPIGIYDLSFANS